MSVERGGTQRTGRPERRASQGSRISSGCGRALAPKLPPMSGAMTRISSGDSPYTCAITDRTGCAPWHDDQWTSRPSSPHSDAPARPSSGQGARR